MAIKDKVLLRLKPKTASLGFKKEHLVGVAVELADNLENGEDATDEEIDAAISVAIPYLKLAQKSANRVIEDARKEEQESKLTESATKSKDGAGNQTTPNNDEAPNWFKTYCEKQEERFSKIEKANNTKIYNAKAADLLKDVDEDFYSLDGKEFENEEQADAYVAEVQGRWVKFSQKMADKGLSTMAKPKGGGQTEGESAQIASLIDEGTKQIVEQSKN